MINHATNLLAAVDAIISASRMSAKMKSRRSSADGVTPLLLSPTLVENLERARDEFVGPDDVGEVQS